MVDNYPTPPSPPAHSNEGGEQGGVGCQSVPASAEQSRQRLPMSKPPQRRQGHEENEGKLQLAQEFRLKEMDRHRRKKTRNKKMGQNESRRKFELSLVSPPGYRARRQRMHADSVNSFSPCIKLNIGIGVLSSRSD